MIEASVGFSVLGPLQVAAAGREVPVTSAKQRLLLAALLVEANSVVSVDRLAEILWGSDQPGDPVQALQSHVSRLRSALGSAGGELAAGVLATRPPGYVIVVGADQVDAHRFERSVAEAKATEDAATVIDLVDGAMSLWRGPPFDGVDHGFARVEAARLEELKLGAIELRADARLALGRHGEVVAELEAMASQHPLREELHGRLMLALYRAGRQADALAVHRRLRDTLADELGLEPSPALRRLQREILEQSDRLKPAPSDDRHVPAGPPVPAAVRPAGALPAETTSFVGRTQEVARAVAALEEARLVTLTGPGGVGKTRLGVRVVRTAADRFPDGAAMCDLSAIGGDEAVVPAVLTALSVQPHPATDPEDALVRFLGSRRFLLFLDNCEHVIGEASRLVERVLGACPQTSVLATSRQPLAVAGEQAWPVAPLECSADGKAPSAAVRLFRDRAVAADPGFRLTADNRGTVEEICRRLDGLPLAIELAATRVRTMTLRDVVEHLDRRFELLISGRRGGASRHRTLQAVVDWSYELLGEDERRLLPRLAVFAGGFDLRAAEEVCADAGVGGGELVAALSGLVDNSLVVADRSGERVRYRLLETLRAYGQALLEREDPDVWRRRHAARYVVLAEEAADGILGPDEGRWVARLDQELDNLRAAHRWTVRAGAVGLSLRLVTALTDYAYSRMRDEIFRWAEDALGLPGAADHPLYPAVCGAVAYGCANRGELRRAASFARRGLDATVGGSQPASLRPLDALSTVALYEGRLDEHLLLSEELTAVARAADVPFMESMGHLTRGLALTYMGRTDDALACVRTGQAIAERTVNPSLLAWSLYSEGEVLLDADPDRASELFERAIEIAGGVGNRLAEGVARVSGASVVAGHGEPRPALTAFRDAVEHWRLAGDWTHQWTTLRSLVVLFARVGAEECAAVLHGAIVAAESAAPLYGSDAARMSETGAVLESALGPERFADAQRRGRMMADHEVVAYVLAEVERLLAGHTCRVRAGPPAPGSSGSRRHDGTG